MTPSRCVGDFRRMQSAMLRERTNTPLFRVALSMALLWVAGWTIAAYFGLKAVPAYDSRPDYYEQRDACTYPIPSLTPSGEFTARAAPQEQVSACLNQVEGTYRRYEASERETVITRSATWEIVPALLILLMTAYWADLIKRLRGWIAAYAGWVRGRPNDPDEPNGPA